MRKTVFVHIGAPAAGAGFLERQLWAHRDTLQQVGIDLVISSPDGTHPGQVWDGIASGVQAGDRPTLVVSDERLAGAPVEQVSAGLAALAADHVHVIYTMPDFGEALVAAWQQHVIDAARPISPAAWIDELIAGEHGQFWRTYDSRDVFARWTMPSGDVHVLISPPAHAHGDGLWQRFASVIGAPPVAEPVLSSTGRFGLEELELYRRVDEHVRDQATDAFDRAKRGLLGRALVTRRVDPQPVLLPAEHRAWIEKHATAQTDFLVASGFEVVGDPVNLELGDERFDDGDAGPDESRMVDSGIDAIAALVEIASTRIGRHEHDRRSSDTSVPGPMRQFMRRVRRVATNPGAADFAIRRRVRAKLSSRDRRTYFIHIGAPKSGSSFLQSLLWQNRYALMRDGVYLPGRSQTDHFLAATDFRERSYATQASDDRWQGAWDRLIDDAERSGCRRILISSEFFSTAGADEIAAKLDRLADAEVHVIYAVRDFPGLLASEWQQGVKTAALPTWHQWLEDTARRGVTGGLWRRHAVGAVGERWASAVDQVHVLVVPRPGGTSDELWSLFQSIVGWKVRTRTDAPNPNESLGYSQAELLRRLQHRLTDVEPGHVRARLTKDLVADGVLANMKRVDSVLIPDHLRAWIESESGKQRQQIVDSEMNVVGDLDNLRVTDSRFSSVPIQPSDTVMVDAAVSVLTKLTQELTGRIADA